MAAQSQAAARGLEVRLQPASQRRAPELGPCPSSVSGTATPVLGPPDVPHEDTEQNGCPLQPLAPQEEGRKRWLRSQSHQVQRKRGARSGPPRGPLHLADSIRAGEETLLPCVSWSQWVFKQSRPLPGRSHTCNAAPSSSWNLLT